MYRFNNRNRNSQFTRRKQSFSRRGIRKLDPTLFVKKRRVSEISQETYTTSAKFSDYNIVDKLKVNIAQHNYSVPTAIQDKAIPQILDGRDIIGIANTGTGKTAAFLITFINKAFLNKDQRVLIVVPTRELAVQIADEFKIFARGMGIDMVATVGGVSIRNQIFSLRRKPQFVVGTPGRLKDLIERRELNLQTFQNIVLDEVDRMVDIGFVNDVKYLVSLLPQIRQSLFFSATIDGRTREILNSFVKEPVTITIKQQSASENIDQDIVRLTDGRSKIDVLHDLLNKPGFDKVMIFGRTKWGAEKLAQALAGRGFKAAAIHGNKTQNQRQRTLQDFKRNVVQILIATDVVSRGIDVEDVTHVINFDAPESYEDYIHRIGRTGRAGKQGVALTFVE